MVGVCDKKLPISCTQTDGRIDKQEDKLIPVYP